MDEDESQTSSVGIGGSEGDGSPTSNGASVDVSDKRRGVRGWWQERKLGRLFWIFLAVSCLFNTGMFIFVLLYNIYLIDIGYKEDFLGWMTSAGTAGNMVGTFTTVLLNRRIGLRRSVMLCFAATAIIAALRALLVGQVALLLLAFCAGAIFALWGISIIVMLAQVTTPQQRPFAFSLYLATVIGVGIVADPIGGRLPGWLNHLFGAANAAEAKQWALLLGAAVIALAVVPASRLRFTRVEEKTRATYPRSSFMLRFLVAVAILNLATGAFNPFSNVYFSQFLKMPVADIGLVFSVAQAAQVVAILLSPLILKKFGIIWGVVVMELAAALSLGFLSAQPERLLAAAAYAGYVSFQWMDEPAMESLLMTRVEPHERTGASALMYLVIFASGAVAAPLAGVGLKHFGYPLVITVAACVMLVGALSFGFLLRKTSEPSPSDAT